MLRDKEFDVGISSTSERCLATPPKNNLCEFFRVQPTCGQEYRQEYETHTADSVSVSVSYSCLYSQKHLHMYTWNHMPHVRGAAEQPLLQTVPGTMSVQAVRLIKIQYYNVCIFSLASTCNIL